MSSASATSAGTGSGTPPASDVKMITLTIDGLSVSVPEKTSVLDAARRAGVPLPALCHKEDVNPLGVCRVCAVMVKNDGSGRPERVFAASCMRECQQGAVIETGCERTSGLR